MRVGILGGGQLARMTIQAAIPLNIDIAIMARKLDSPAGRLTQHEFEAAGWFDTDALAQLAAVSDVITLENEFVDARVLRHLVEVLETPVFPDAHTLALIQDKLRQKDALHTDGIPVPRYRSIHKQADIIAAAEEFGWPLVLKARRNGYDGYGNATLQSADDIGAAWADLGDRDLLVEAWVEFERELAVMVVRTHTGETFPYPVVETVQRNHICHLVRAPAPIPDEVASRAVDVAVEAVNAVEGVGIFGVELFGLPSGEILFNEMAPRPHNSGHYTIEGCLTSQFQNHLRAVLGWPLGAVEMTAPAAVMVNILGERQGRAKPEGLIDALAVPGAHVHLYGKRDVRPGRKMGHVTALATSLEAAEALAQEAVDRVIL